MSLNVKTTILTNYGYLIKKDEWTEMQLTKMKDDLTVVPELDNKYSIQESEAFPIYQEGEKRILLPKFYGLEKIGLPKTIKMNVESIDRVKFKFIKEANRIWLATYDPLKNRVPDPKDAVSVKNFIKAKYIEKK